MALRTSFVVTVLALRTLFASAVQLKQSERIGQLPDVMDSSLSDSLDELEATDALNETDSRLVDELIYAPQCKRGYQCGVLSEAVQSPVRVECPRGDMYFAHDALFIPSTAKTGRNLVYCSIPKVGTSYMFWVMSQLGLETKKGGKRNSEYYKVHEIANDKNAKEELCNAYSFLLVRNPWDRLVSGYVDKVKSKRLMSRPPSFRGFMKEVERANSSQLNHHFRPASLLCSTTGEHKQKYHKVIRLEGNVEGNLEYLFHDVYGLSREKVRTVLAAGVTSGASHNTSTSGYSAEWENSGLERTSYYFGQSNPHIVEKIFEDDIAFGNYKFVGKNKHLKLK